MSRAEPYTLADAAAALGVHYMTAYRYVRTGRLEARQVGSSWSISAADVERFRRAGAPAPLGPRSRSRRGPAAARRLAARLLAGDENGAWELSQEALTGGALPKQVYLDLLVPAMRLVGVRWREGAITVADEHRASIVVQRLMGRLGPLFRPRGPRRGTVIVGAPAGERHGLPTAFVGDILRGEGFDVVDLGADVPADAFTHCASQAGELLAIAISITIGRHRRSAATLVRTLRAGGIHAPIVVGGAGSTEQQALAFGADVWTPDPDAAVRALEARVRDRRGREGNLTN